MTFGEKLCKLRKENNYTQEQLADILQVSRQSVSKWELDISYPETDKLIEIGELFNCSMDYLLKDNVSQSSPSFKDKNDDAKQMFDKIVTKKNLSILKRVLIISAVVFAAIFIVFMAIFFVPLMEKINEMWNSNNQRACMSNNCENVAIDGGEYCEIHTCIEHDCFSQKTYGDYCTEHILTNLE